MLLPKFLSKFQYNLLRLTVKTALVNVITFYTRIHIQSQSHPRLIISKTNVLLTFTCRANKICDEQIFQKINLYIRTAQTQITPITYLTYHILSHIKYITHIISNITSSHITKHSNRTQYKPQIKQPKTLNKCMRNVKFKLEMYHRIARIKANGFFKLSRLPQNSSLMIATYLLFLTQVS